jgi:CrcB protein
MASDEIARRVLWVALGGALGAVARYGIALWSLRYLGGALPWGTTIANLLGCLLFGVLWVVLGSKSDLHVAWKLVVLTGFLGAFTTFSTFVFESLRLLQADRPWWGIANVVGQNVLGLGCVYAGVWGARLLR